MAQNFIACDREQLLLMSPSLRDWLPEGHLAWFVIGVVEDLDLGGFYRRYRDDGWGRAAYDPAMMVGLLLYAYARGVRSSRAIEQRCVEDIAFRVIAANLVPDHVTINRFRVEHQDALAELFGQVLGMCGRAGLVQLGTVALDGTRIAANASMDANADYEQLARRILEEAAEIDAAEDEVHGQERGDELPEELQSREGRQRFLNDFKQQIAAKRQANPAPVPQQRPKRLREAKRRFEEGLWVEQRANEAYESWRASGPRRGPRAAPYEPPRLPTGKINTTDLDSKIVPSRRGFLQGYTAQAASTADQIIVAVDVIAGANERRSLAPLVDRAAAELAAVGVSGHIEVVLADAGYWNNEQIKRLQDRGLRPLVCPDSAGRSNPGKLRRGRLWEWMRAQLDTPEGSELYRQRKAMIEPIFGQTKHNRGITRFQRRGLLACRAEWKFIAATHNLLKLHTHPAAG